MRKASKVLGLIAGIFTLLLSLLFITSRTFSMAAIQMFMPGIISAVAGILGLVAASIIKKHPTPAGLMMIIGAVFCVVSSLIGTYGFFYFILMVLFILGGVFALIPQQIPEQPAPAAENPPENPQP